MRRVVITGMGVVSSIGNNKDEVLNSLQNGKSGIVAMPKFAEKGFDSQVAGTIKNLDLDKLIDKRDLRFMGKGSAYAYISMQQAISDAGLSDDIISNEKQNEKENLYNSSTRKHNDQHVRAPRAVRRRAAGGRRDLRVRAGGQRARAEAWRLRDVPAPLAGGRVAPPLPRQQAWRPLPTLAVSTALPRFSPLPTLQAGVLPLRLLTWRLLLPPLLARKLRLRLRLQLRLRV